MRQFDKSLVRFRRDLRSFDHAALFHALRHSRAVYCAFIFDRAILDPLPKADRRVEFIHSSLSELNDALCKMGGALIVRQGFARREIPLLATELGVDAVFANHDYEPEAAERDAEVGRSLAFAGRRFLTYKDQAIFEKDEVLSLSGKPFSVFTPYKNAWLKKLNIMQGDFHAHVYPIEKYAERLARPVQRILGRLPSLQEIGFEPTNLKALDILPGMSGGQALFDDFLPRIGLYGAARDFPGRKGPSYLSVHLRFGTVSVRGLVRMVFESMCAGGESAAASGRLHELFNSLILQNFSKDYRS